MLLYGLQSWAPTAQQLVRLEVTQCNHLCSNDCPVFFICVHMQECVGMAVGVGIVVSISPNVDRMYKEMSSEWAIHSLLPIGVFFLCGRFMD